MRLIFWSSVLSVLLSPNAAPLRAQSPSIIESGVERRQGPPLWLSAEAVADEEKIIRLDLLDSPALRMYVEKQQREIEARTPDEGFQRGEKPAVTVIPPSECKDTQYSTGQSHRGGPGPKSTFLDLVANSRTILRGTVRTVDLGFDGGVPASLLGIEISAAIKGSSSKPLVYVLYPVAHFRIGPLRFCNARQGFEPRSGDQILIFDSTGTVDRDHLLLAPHLNQIFFERQGGTLFIPPQIRRSPGMDTLRTLDEVVDRLDLNAAPSSTPRGSAR